jgi:hypothetical protein
MDIGLPPHELHGFCSKDMLPARDGNASAGYELAFYRYMKFHYCSILGVFGFDPRHDVSS